MFDISEETASVFKRNIRVGVFSNILQGVWTHRQNIKKQMKSCDEQQYPLLDARQLAIKLFMNSFFGLTGVTSNYAMLYCPYVA